VVGFSGKFIAPLECVNKTTPVSVKHGEFDDVVDVSSMEEIIE
jgi:predicted esterase